jgi:hypothetical protein
MSTLLDQLYSRNIWLADGSQTVWNFTFAGPVSDNSLTYISREHVKAYWQDEAGSRTEYVFQDADWLGDYQLNVIPAPPAGQVFVIYRQTPRERPLVDYNDGAAVSETSLDTNARQAVYLAQEALDLSGIDNDDYGFKALKQVPYTDASTVVQVNNGRSHYKEDGTQVIVPSTLLTEYLTTIINNSDDPMLVTFADEYDVDGITPIPSGDVGHQMGDVSPVGVASFTILPRNAVGLNKVSDGHWFFNGAVE